MEPGDLVRFRRELYPRKSDTDCGMWRWSIGLLVEYEPWEKIATILYDGKIYRIHISEVQKAGKKD